MLKTDLFRPIYLCRSIYSDKNVGYKLQTANVNVFEPCQYKKKNMLH